MSFLKNIMRDLGRAAQEVVDGGHTTLDAKLFTLLNKMVETKENGDFKSKELGDLCGDIVFFVLNGSDFRNNERAFVAGLNWANLGEKVIKQKLFDNTEYVGRTINDIQDDTTLIFSTDKEDLREKEVERKYINNCWNIVWDDYLKLTQEEEKNGLFTLNHWLLTKTIHPLNIGILWGREFDKRDGDFSNFYLPEETLKLLGIRNVDRAAFNSLQLPRQTNYNGEYDRALTRLKNHIMEMGQKIPKDKIDKNVGFSAYHVIRSYGGWGGKAFYSLPVYYGSGDDKNIGILSLCSKKPLDENAMLKWTLVANLVFKEVILHELTTIKSIERKKSFSLTTHSLKTEINTTLRPQFNRINTYVKAKLIDHKELHLDVDKLGRQIEEQYLLTGLNSLIDKLDQKDKFRDSGLKDKLLSETEEMFDLAKMIETFNSDHRHMHEIYLVNPEAPILNITVRGCHLSAVLIELFYKTLCENMIEYCERVEGKIHFDIKFNIVNESGTNYNVWIFSNRMRNERAEINETKLRGNLYLFKTLIEDTDSGSLRIDAQNHMFKVILKLPVYE